MASIILVRCLTHRPPRAGIFGISASMSACSNAGRAGKGEMLDQIVASRGLLAFFDHAEVHNEILPDESGAFHTDVKFPESDHAPVVDEFTIN